MNQLQKSFNYDNQSLRTVIQDEELWFVARDVCGILDIKNSHDALSRLDIDDKATSVLPTQYGSKEMNLVNESGLYSLIFTSRKQEAKSFKRWVTSEVLPSIRKHGAYATDQTIENIINNPDFGIELLRTLKSERDQRLQAEQERNRVIEQRKLDMPYTTFGKVVSSSDASINVGAFAKLMYDKHGVKLGRNKMFEWLRDNGYLIKSGRERNNPKQQYIEQGLFETTVTLVSRTQGDVESLTTLITGKGQVNLAEILINEYKAVI